MYEQEDLSALFKEEAVELVEQLDVLVDSMNASTPSKRRDILPDILRVLHNLKGASKTLGYNGMSKLCNNTEEELAAFKNDASIPDEACAQLTEAARVLVHLIDSEVPDDVQFDAVSDGTPDNGSMRNQRTQNNGTIRVDSARFDVLMGFSGDLLMSRARMEEQNRRLKAVAESLERNKSNVTGDKVDFVDERREISELTRAHTRDLIDFQHLTDRITDAMKRLRMVPLRLAQREWREVAHKAALVSNKEVDVEIRTGDTQIDKRVLDRLRDPMTHLLRNAVDHGLESPETRKAAGKSSAGKIEIEASLKGAMVELIVRDDGRGIDREKLRTAAVRLGFAAPMQLGGFSDEGLLDLLFHPGFTTAEKATDLSGRGVGLDVVRSRIESMGGKVNVHSLIGVPGTAFTLSVPLSVMSTVGLHVTSSGTDYAFPLEYVERTFQINNTDLGYLDGQTVFRSATDDPVRLVRLSALVDAPNAVSVKQDKVVLLSRSNVRLGVLVDSIEDQYEFVTQPLPWNLKKMQGVSGGSLRPNGNVLVVLDVPFLFEKAGALSYNAAASQDEAKIKGATKRVLVVDDSLAARTLEKNILLSGGFDVSVAEDGEAAWRRLQEASFDLLVSDVDMPNMNGLELTRRIRKSDAFQDLPVILVTSMDSADARAAGADAGADEYVVKGMFDQGTLLEVISRYL